MSGILARIGSMGGGFPDQKVMKGHEGTIRQTCFSSDGKLAVTASGDHTARVWDLESFQCISVMGSCPKNLTGGGIGTGHEHVVSGCDFSPDCTLICTSSNDKVRVTAVPALPPRVPTCTSKRCNVLGRKTFDVHCPSS